MQDAGWTRPEGFLWMHHDHDDVQLTLLKRLLAYSKEKDHMPPESSWLCGAVALELTNKRDPSTINQQPAQTALPPGAGTRS
jgi:hypothetical protein